VSRPGRRRAGSDSSTAHRRLSLDERGRAVVELERRHFDGRTHIAFEPGELLRTLATRIPPAAQSPDALLAAGPGEDAEFSAATPAARDEKDGD
jgi:hypothetical protein